MAHRRRIKRYYTRSDNTNYVYKIRMKTDGTFPPLCRFWHWYDFNWCLTETPSLRYRVEITEGEAKLKYPQAFT